MKVFSRPVLSGLWGTALALLGACSPFYAKPWKTPEQRKDFMLTMGLRLLSPQPLPNHCIEQLKRELAAEKKTGERSSSPRALCGAPASEEVRKEQEQASCETALRNCGSCHLPRVNNCTYSVEVMRPDAKATGPRLPNDPRIHSVEYGRVVGVGFSAIELDRRDHGPEMDPPRAGSRRVPFSRILSIRWENGADPLSTWWDFRRLSPRGEMARRMFHLSQTHQVGCTNCHVGHGDFRFTAEGEHFRKTGEVIRKVSLQEFLRETKPK